MVINYTSRGHKINLRLEYRHSREPMITYFDTRSEPVELNSARVKNMDSQSSWE